MTAKEKLKDDLVLSRRRIVIIPQLNLIMEKGADRGRENLLIINKIILLILEEDDQTPGRDLIFILKINRPAADRNYYYYYYYYSSNLRAHGVCDYDTLPVM